MPRIGEQPAESSVLVPPELLEQLRELKRSAVPGETGDSRLALVLEARYEGKLVEIDRKSFAQFDAVFQVLSLSDEATANLALEGPLTGPILLDGALATLADRPATGHAVKVPRKGRHKIELQFRLPINSSVSGTAEDRGIPLNLPRVPASRLRFHGPAGAVALHAQGCQGWQRLLPGEAGKIGPTLEVDLGRPAGLVQLAWYQESGPDNRPARVQFQEAYLWELHGEANTLTGLVHYRITRGTVQSLPLDVPGDLELRNAEAFRVRRAVGPDMVQRPALEQINDGSVRLRGWRPEGGTVHLDFQGPVTGDLVVALELIPRRALPMAFALPLPAPRGELLPGVSYLAYRAVGLDAHRQSTLRLTGIQPAEFAPFWPAVSRPQATALQYCCSFRREPGKPPVLVVRLGWPVPNVQVSQEIQVRVGSAQAELKATAELTEQPGTPGGSPSKCLNLIEWHLQGPSWVVAGVTGPEVRRWSQSGQRLLIWLEHSSAATRLELTGWLSLADEPGTSGPMRRQGKFDLPTLRLVPARTQKTTVRVQAEPGVRLLPGGLRNLRPVAAQASAVSPELVYQTQNIAYGASFQALPAPDSGLTAGAVRVLTLVEEQDQQLVFSSSLVYRLPAGDRRTVQVRCATGMATRSSCMGRNCRPGRCASGGRAGAIGSGASSCRPATGCRR